MTKHAVTVAARKGAERIRQSEMLTKAQAKGETLTTTAQAKAQELATKAQGKGWQVAEQTRAKGSELAGQMRRGSGQVADRGLRRLGEQLSQGGIAQPLGIQPTKRRVPLWLAALLGIAGGYALGVLTAPKPGAELRGQLARPARSTITPQAERIRSKLSNDPRTAELSDLTVEVTDGTVSIQGRIPPDFEQDVLREVIARMPGIHDIDLQLTAGS
jgi:hypothetical protein